MTVHLTKRHIRASDPHVQNPIREEKEILIMRIMRVERGAVLPDSYQISLTFKREDLPRIKKALEPLGYTFRFPRRS